MYDFETLNNICAGYLPADDLVLIRKAFEFACKRHGGMKHASGEPYEEHLLAVAHTLASMHMDRDTVLGGLLHGALKEEVATQEELAKLFGNDVANIVDGVTRITRIRYDQHLADQAESIRKLFLAMGADIRVLLVRLADRIQDMTTLGSAPEKVRRYISRETMDLYAPLASRLGIDWLKRELEDYAFSYLFPAEYKELSEKLESSLSERQAYVDEVITILKQKLHENGVFPLRILGRPKHIYSIYKKLIVQGISLDRVYDKVAFRIIVSTIRECYESLGIVHGAWRPVPGRIKDFINSPKSNNYQSLHTTVIGPDDYFIEIQIRTDEMDRIAQEGVAAHWAYKDGQEISQSDSRLFAELKNLVQSLQEVDDPNEFMESVRGALFEPDVFALTPSGEVKELPRGSTPLDFAYAIHSEVGDTCVGAIVNDRIVPLKYELQTGDVVEITTRKNQRPRRSWLQFVKTSKARSRIKQWLQKDEKERCLKIGKEILERELRRRGFSLKRLLREDLAHQFFHDLRCNSLDELFIKLGSGKISLKQVARVKIFGQEDEERDILEQTGVELATDESVVSSPDDKSRVAKGIEVEGLGDMMVKVSKCCRPVPGDEVMGFITKGSGISIHKSDCPNLLVSDSERWLAVDWSASGEVQHPALLLVKAEHSRKIHLDIISTISSCDAVILDIKSRTRPDDTTIFDIVIKVRDLAHFSFVKQKVKQLQQVIEVHRK